ncbi:hypothetical protein [Thalassotalea euphylliae]|nr:hypothetical protein [Thalassotalea euphylliae]
MQDASIAGRGGIIPKAPMNNKQAANKISDLTQTVGNAKKLSMMVPLRTEKEHYERST